MGIAAQQKRDQKQRRQQNDQGDEGDQPPCHIFHYSFAGTTHEHGASTLALTSKINRFLSSSHNSMMFSSALDESFRCAAHGVSVVWMLVRTLSEKEVSEESEQWYEQNC